MYAAVPSLSLFCPGPAPRFRRSSLVGESQPSVLTILTLCSSSNLVKQRANLSLWPEWASRLMAMGQGNGSGDAYADAYVKVFSTQAQDQYPEGWR